MPSRPNCSAIIALGAWLGCALGAPGLADAQAPSAEEQASSVAEQPVPEGTSPGAAVSLRFEGDLCRAEGLAYVASVDGLRVPHVAHVPTDAVGADDASSSPGEALAPALHGVISVHPATASGFMLVLVLEEAGEALGERRITGASCREVLEAAALVVSLARSLALPPSEDPDGGLPVTTGLAVVELDGAAPPAGAGPLFGAMLAAPPQRLSSALGAPPARSAATREHVRSHRDDPPPSDQQAPDPSDQPGLTPSIGLSLLLAVGELPVPAPGLEGRAGIAVGPIRLEGAGRYIFDQEVALAQHPTGRVRIGLAAGSVGACLPLAFGALTVGPCLGLEVGAIWGESTGVTDPGAATSPWVAPWATATATAEVLPWLRFRADAGLTVPVVATDFVVDGIGVVHRPAAATFRLGIGAEVHFR